MPFNNVNSKALITEIKQLQNYCLTTLADIEFFEKKIAAIKQRDGDNNLSATNIFLLDLQFVKNNLIIIKLLIKNCLEADSKAQQISHPNLKVLEREFKEFQDWYKMEEDNLKTKYETSATELKTFHHQNKEDIRRVGQILLGISAIITLGGSLILKGLYTKFMSGKFSIFTDKTNTQLSSETAISTLEGVTNTRFTPFKR